MTRGDRLLLAGLVVLAVAGLGYELARDFVPAKLSVLFFLLAWFPLIALHELGHAFAAWICGWRVQRIVVGYGGALWRFRLGSVPVQVGKLPLGGFVELAPRHLRQVRLRSAFIYFMGPGAELALLGALVLVFGARTLLSASVVPTVIAAQAVCVAVLLSAFTNLLPLTARREGSLSGPVSATDGLGIVMSFLWPRRVFEERLREAERD